MSFSYNTEPCSHKLNQ